MTIVGAISSGSSSVPARMNSRCGRSSAAEVTGVPHVPQKPRTMCEPLSATERYSASVPVIRTASLGKQTFTPAVPPPRYWHSRHQQVRDASGAAVIS